MAVEEPNVRAAPQHTDGRDRIVEVIRWLLLAALVLDLLVGLITLPRASSLSDLQRDLRAGHVRSLAFDDGFSVGTVRLVRDGAVPGKNQDVVVWRTGTLRYKSAPMEPGSDFGTPAGGNDTQAALRKGITTVATRAGVPIRSKGDQDLLGRWALAVFLVYLVLLVTLIWGEQPRRTTKWATFWLLALPLNAGMILTLIREAPWSRRARELPEPPPHKLARLQGHEARTTGGHAFLFLVFTAAVVLALEALVARL